MQVPSLDEMKPPNLQILVVEDHEMMRENLCRYLELCGHAVESAVSVEAAQTALAAANYDVLFVDLQLPDGDGLELLRHLGTRRGRVAVTMSGFDGAALTAGSRKAGVMAHLPKPFSPQEIDTVLAKVARAVRNPARRASSRKSPAPPSR
jgi:CheY-like chemotaxis protein